MTRLAILAALVLLVVALRRRERHPVWLGFDVAEATTVAVARRADGTLEIARVCREPDSDLQPADPYPASLLP